MNYDPDIIYGIFVKPRALDEPSHLSTEEKYNSNSDDKLSIIVSATRVHKELSKFINITPKKLKTKQSNHSFQYLKSLLAYNTQTISANKFYLLW